jgi:hypothetical protein
MKKLLPLVLGLSLILSACMPPFLEQTINPAPSATEASSAAIVTETQAPQPTATLVPASTATPAPTSTNSPPPPTETSTLPPTEAGATATATAFTPGPGTPTLTFTSVTFTATLGFQSFGTLPPLVPSGKILLMNKSHAQAYISLQCINKEGTLSIMEFPVSKWTEVKVPSGKCDYVAWVGGRQFAGKFSLDTGGQRTITLYKNRIKIK